jgi:hypothetical protein
MVRTRHRPLLSWTLHCPTCGTDVSAVGFPHRSGTDCGHRPSFLAQIPVVEVLEESLDLVGRGRDGRSGMPAEGAQCTVDAWAHVEHVSETLFDGRLLDRAIGGHEVEADIGAPGSLGDAHE